MTKRHILALALTLAGLVLVISPAGAEVASQATSIRRTFYPFHIDANHSDAILNADQDGTGSIANFSDGGTNEYTFDQSSATFVNQLNLSDDLKVGDGTPGVTLNGEDVYIEGTLEVDGASNLAGAITFGSGGLTLGGVVTNAEDLEHIGLMTHLTTAFTYTASAGGTVTLATIGAGEEWLVHEVLLEVTTNFDATGDDAVLTIGDGNDPDGFCVLADAELQAADTEGTGWSAGWQCQVAATRGVYQDGTGGFMYDEGSTETIDAVISASGNDLSAGAATAHIWYTRLP